MLTNHVIHFVYIFKIEIAGGEDKTRKTYHCEHCLKTFKTKHSLNSHILCYHEVTKCLKCSDCGAVYTVKNRKRYANHLRSIHNYKKVSLAQMQNFVFVTLDKTKRARQSELAEQEDSSLVAGIHKTERVAGERQIEMESVEGDLHNLSIKEDKGGIKKGWSTVKVVEHGPGKESTGATKNVFRHRRSSSLPCKR